MNRHLTIWHKYQRKRRQAFGNLKLEKKLNIESTEDLVNFMKEFTAANKEEVDVKPKLKKKESKDKNYASSRIPRLSQFYGKKGKGEVN